VCAWTRFGTSLQQRRRRPPWTWPSRRSRGTFASPPDCGSRRRSASAGRFRRLRPPTRKPTTSRLGGSALPPKSRQRWSRLAPGRRASRRSARGSQSGSRPRRSRRPQISWRSARGASRITSRGRGRTGTTTVPGRTSNPLTTRGWYGGTGQGST
jgi:hypothetical protein